MKTRVSLKYFVNDSLRKQVFPSNFPQAPSNLMSLIILVTLRPSHSFNLKLEQLSSKKVFKPALLGNYFSHFFTKSKFGIKRFSSLF